VHVKAGSVVRIKPGTAHSISALESLLLHEYSSPHPDDVVELT